MILVTGATGQFGSKAIDYLLKTGVESINIAALVRDISKAQILINKGIDVRLGDYSDQLSLINALQNVDKILLVSSNDRQAVENRTAQHKNVIEAAKSAQVKHIVYTSFIRKSNFADSAIAAFQNSHVQSETFLKESGISYTILQNGIYFEMIPVFAGQKVAETGLIFFPAGEGKASYVLREELAEAAAYILNTEGHENKIYQLTNSESVSFDDVAESLSDTLEKTVHYQSPTINEFESKLKESGVPDLYISMFTTWASAQKQGALDIEDHTLEKFLGRKPTSLKQFTGNVYKKM